MNIPELGEAYGASKVGVLSRYLFNDRLDILVCLRSGAGLGAGGLEVRENFVIGEDSGLGDEHLGVAESMDGLRKFSLGSFGGGH